MKNNWPVSGKEIWVEIIEEWKCIFNEKKEKNDDDLKSKSINVNQPLFIETWSSLIRTV